MATRNYQSTCWEPDRTAIRVLSSRFPRSDCAAAEDCFPRPHCLTDRWLFVRGRGFVCQVLVVEDGVEHESVRSDGLAAIDGVVAEQQHVSLAQVCIHHYSMLGNRCSFV